MVWMVGSFQQVARLLAVIWSSSKDRYWNAMVGGVVGGVAYRHEEPLTSIYEV